MFFGEFERRFEREANTSIRRAAAGGTNSNNRSRGEEILPIFYQRWDTESLKEHILAREGVEPLNSYYYATHYPAVYAAAERMFGSWGEAIAACGLDYEQIRKYKAWNREKIIAEIQERHGRNEPLNSQYIQQNNHSLYMASLRAFGSWGGALRHAGVDYDKIRLRRRWDSERVREAILELYQSGADLAAPNMRMHYQYLLAAGAKKLGNGSWAMARTACGISENFRSSARRSKFSTED